MTQNYNDKQKTIEKNDYVVLADARDDSLLAIVLHVDTDNNVAYIIWENGARENIPLEWIRPINK